MRNSLRLHPAPGDVSGGGDSRLNELLAARALDALAASEQDELDMILAKGGNLGGRGASDELERTVAMLLPALHELGQSQVGTGRDGARDGARVEGSPMKTLPADLFEKLRAQGEAMTAANRSNEGGSSLGRDGRDVHGSASGSGVLRVIGTIGWLAAAASLAFAVVFYQRWQTERSQSMRLAATIAERDGELAAATADRDTLSAQLASATRDLLSVNERLAVATTRLTAAEELAQLMLNSDNTVIPWNAQADPNAAGLSGQVVWNTRLQKGFMRFKGLKTNDPAAEQYQAWIFDEGREKEYPVDAGVFDIAKAVFDPKSGDYVVPIEAKLAVRDPALFAVTVERPGGVVVTKKQRIVAVAPVQR